MLTIKLFHILAFCVAVGGGVASMILGIRAAKADAAGKLTLRGGMKTIGAVSFASILLLWLTGFALWGWGYGFDAPLGGLFHTKLLAVVGITVLSSVSFAAPRLGKPIPPGMARIMGAATLTLAVIAIALALVVFDG